MLSQLYISNYALIHELEIDFSSGFTVLTGETGAGKSILLGALGLILGERAESNVLNQKDKKCVVEGKFLIDLGKFHSFFELNNLDAEEETFVRREISTKGKSRAFINDTPVTISLLKEFSSRLINIHSQHHNLLIGEATFQVRILDGFAGINNLIDDYKEFFNSFSSKRKKLEELKEIENKGKAEEDYLQFQLKELHSLELKENEQSEIEEELKKINNLEGIKSALSGSTFQLYDAEDNVLLRLKSILSELQGISSFSDEYNVVSERMNSIIIELADLNEEIISLNEGLDFDEQSANYLNERISLIYQLEKKHNVNGSDELLEIIKNLEIKLNEISSVDDEIVHLEKEIANDRDILLTKAKQISEKRKTCKQKLEKQILDQLAGLGMQNAIFKIELIPMAELGENGMDEVMFKFSANKGYEPLPINKVASGGEMSRLMLVIKELLAKNNGLSTLIFDEIDTGVSGDIADKMGTMMHSMSKKAQVIAITHLPQVAAKGIDHLKIYKEVNGEQTRTFLQKLANQERVEELAKMLSGKDLTKAAIENAKNLIAN